jgi:hypothetical protein
MNAFAVCADFEAMEAVAHGMAADAEARKAHNAARPGEDGTEKSAWTPVKQSPPPKQRAYQRYHSNLGEYGASGECGWS